MVIFNFRAQQGMPNQIYIIIFYFSNFQGRTMLSHDYVFWCGDFNYRINMCREDVVTCVKNSDWETLLSADQLKIEHGNGNVFEDFNEADIGK